MDGLTECSLFYCFGCEPTLDDHAISPAQVFPPLNPDPGGCEADMGSAWPLLLLEPTHPRDKSVVSYV